MLFFSYKRNTAVESAILCPWHPALQYPELGHETQWLITQYPVQTVYLLQMLTKLAVTCEWAVR